jgi:hypothetical protein
MNSDNHSTGFNNFDPLSQKVGFRGFENLFGHAAIPGISVYHGFTVKPLDRID